MIALAGWLLLSGGLAGAPQIGEAAPAFELPALDGTRVRLAPAAGQVTVVEFFATWCGPCARSLADLRGLRAELGDRLRVTIIAVDSPDAALRAYFGSHPLPEGATVAIDASGEVARRWGEDRLPTTFLLDDRAAIRHINRGHGPGFPDRMRRWVTTMLARPAGSK